MLGGFSVWPPAHMEQTGLIMGCVLALKSGPLCHFLTLTAVSPVCVCPINGWLVND